MSSYLVQSLQHNEILTIFGFAYQESTQEITTRETSRVYAAKNEMKQYTYGRMVAKIYIVMDYMA